MKTYVMTPKYSIELEASPHWNIFGILYENNAKLFILDIVFIFLFRVHLMIRKSIARQKGAR